MAALGTVSVVAAGAVVVEPHEGWHEPVNLYLNVLAAPGEGKTPAMRKVVRPLDLIETERSDRIGPLRQDAGSRLRIAHTRVLDDSKRRPRKPIQRTELSRSKTRSRRAGEVASIVVPAPPRLYTREATPEALVRLLAEQRGRIAVVTDQGSEFFEMAARYSTNRRANLGVYLDGWDGKRHASDRVGREPIVIACATLTVLPSASLLCSPTLGQILKCMGAECSLGSCGRCHRANWATGPSIGRQCPEALTSDWANLIIDLARQAEELEEPIVLPLSLGRNASGTTGAEFTSPGYVEILETSPASSSGPQSSPVKSLRLAGNLHVLRTGRISGRIDEETMAAAIRLAEYFTDHALVAFARMGLNKGLEDAHLILRWLEGRDVDTFTTRDACRSKEWPADRVRAALGILAEYEWVRRVIHEQGTGRPSELWERNPEISGQNLTVGSVGRVASGSVRQSEQIRGEILRVPGRTMTNAMTMKNIRARNGRGRAIRSIETVRQDQRAAEMRSQSMTYPQYAAALGFSQVLEPPTTPFNAAWHSSPPKGRSWREVWSWRSSTASRPTFSKLWSGHTRRSTREESSSSMARSFSTTTLGSEPPSGSSPFRSAGRSCSGSTPPLGPGCTSTPMTCSWRR